MEKEEAIEDNKEQLEFLNLVCSNIKSLRPIQYNRLGDFIEKKIFPQLNNYEVGWIESLLIGYCLVNLAFTKELEELRKHKTENNTIISEALENHRRIIFEMSIKSREMINLADSINLKRGSGFDSILDDKAISLNLTKRFGLLDKYNFSCAYCGRRPPEVYLELEHIIPLSKGGRSIQSNLVPACYDCNHGKRDKDISEESMNRIRKFLDGENNGN